MIRDRYLGCQYRDLGKTFHSGLLDHSTLVRQAVCTAAENPAFRFTLYSETPASDRVGNILCLYGEGKTRMFIS